MTRRNKVPHELVAFLEKNLDRMVQETLRVSCQRFQSYRQASDIEMANVEKAIRAKIHIILDTLQGKTIDEAGLQATLMALGERRAQQGYPLVEVLGIFHLARVVVQKYIRQAIRRHSTLRPHYLLDVDSILCSLFARIEAGVIGPYLQVQENIIQTQQAFLKHKLTSLFKVVEGISNNLNIREFSGVLLNYLCRFYDLKIACVFLLDEREQELYPEQVMGLSRRFQNEQRWSSMEGPVKQCVAQGRVLAIEDTPFEESDITAPLPNGESTRNKTPGGRQKEDASSRPTCYSLYAPVNGRQRTYGVLSLHDLRPRKFTSTEIQQFETLARIFAVALENARFYQNLIEEKSKLDSIVNSISDGLILIDFHEEIVFINDQAARFFQQPAYKILGASASIIPERLFAQTKDIHVLQAIYMRSLNTIGDHPSMEFTLYRSEVLDVRLTMFPVRDRDHHFIGRGLILEDMSHEKEISRMKSEFVAIASHTMRTPMTSILGFSSLLIEKKLPEPTRHKYLQNIHRESQRLTTILDDMLDLVNIEAGKIALKLAPIQIADLVQAALREFKKLSSVPVRLSCGSKEMPKLIADRQKVMHVLLHLLGNASRYSQGGIHLQVKCLQGIQFKRGWKHSDVQLDLPGLFPAIAFCLEDTGEGIPEDQLNEIFEPFHRIRNEKTRLHEGSGLGLTIARYIVEAHGGKIWSESAAEKGSRFTFLLPLELTRPDRNVSKLAV